MDKFKKHDEVKVVKQQYEHMDSIGKEYTIVDVSNTPSSGNRKYRLSNGFYYNDDEIIRKDVINKKHLSAEDLKSGMLIQFSNDWRWHLVIINYVGKDNDYFGEMSEDQISSITKVAKVEYLHDVLSVYNDRNIIVRNLPGFEIIWEKTEEN